MNRYRKNTRAQLNLSRFYARGEGLDQNNTSIKVGIYIGIES